MGTLDNSIGSGIVATDLDMLNVVLFLQITERGDKRFAIVRDDFYEGAPSAQDVLEDPVPDGLCGFFSEHSEF